MTKRGNFRERVRQRREEAELRQVARNERGDVGQFDRLNKLGYTATREKIRLLNRMETSK